jgi:hypothetical protein
MKSVEQQLSEVADNLKQSGHLAIVNEVLGADAGKNLEEKLSKLTTFAESNGIAAREEETTTHANLVEAAMKTFGMTKQEAEIFARPNSSSVDTKWADLLKETK